MVAHKGTFLPVTDVDKRAHLHRLGAFLSARYDVHAFGPGLYLQGLNGALDYCGLVFGQMYSVRKSVDANRQSGFMEGEQLRYVGAYFFPYENGLRLFFEDMDGLSRQVEFCGISGHRTGELDTALAHRVLAEEYLEPIPEPDSARAQALARFAYCSDLVRRGYG